VAVYRITQEALTNVMRHAEATEVDISVRVDERVGTLSLDVVDNGLGFHNGPPQTSAFNTSSSNGIGLAGIRERVWANQGLIAIETADPHGLALRAIFPLTTAAEETLRTQARDLSRSAAIPALS
jgi:two-component system sensor histidine kinase UhpB